MGQTRRAFIRTSSGAVAATALALHLPPAARAAATGPIAGASHGLAGGSGDVERTRSFRAGVPRPTAWSRCGGSHRIALLDAGGLEICTPFRGRTLHHSVDPSTRDAIAREFGPGVLQEVLAELRRA